MSDAEEGGAGDPPPDCYRFDRTVNKRVGSPAAVTEADLGFFQEHGYLVVEDVLEEAAVDDALAGMEELLAAATDQSTDVPADVVQFDPSVTPEDFDPTAVAPETALDHVRKFWRFSEHSDALAAPASDPALLDLVGTLVDGTPEMFQDMALTKPPGGGGEKPWHQDKAYFEVELDAPVVGVWIALDEATPENGCMHLIPGSHRDGPVPHFQRRDWQLCDTDVQTDEDVMAPLEPGSALVFDGLLHHGTPPNTSDSRRRALQFHYTAADATWLDERPAAFGNTDPDVEC